MSVKALTRENPAWKETLDPRLPYIGAEIIWATRYEMARRIEDILARRTEHYFWTPMLLSPWHPAWRING
ncbi:MAG: glycerol-3-phosphate dehydrogenase C-terminal domain-containing protein [Puia sp.]